MTTVSEDSRIEEEEMAMRLMELDRRKPAQYAAVVRMVEEAERGERTPMDANGEERQRAGP